MKAGTPKHIRLDLSAKLIVPYVPKIVGLVMNFVVLGLSDLIFSGTSATRVCDQLSSLNLYIYNT